MTPKTIGCTFLAHHRNTQFALITDNTFGFDDINVVYEFLIHLFKLRVILLYEFTIYAGIRSRNNSKNIPQRGRTLSKQSTTNKSISKKSISSQTNHTNNTNAFQKKLAHSLANLIPVLESQITKKIEATYLVKIRALEKEIKRLKEEHSSLLYRNSLPTIHENNN